MSAASMIEITVLAKDGGPLTKRISLGPDGAIHADGSACAMARGSANRVTFDDLAAFAECIARLASHEAIALGALRDDLPDQVRVATKATLNGHSALDRIARTGDNFCYRPGRPALVLIDIDTKGMPPAVQDRIAALGGFWPALASVLPELATAGHVLRASTSAGLSHSVTGEPLAGSNGCHVYVLVTDGADAKRLLQGVHDRCWLHGLGWLMVGAAGQFLERSLVDRMVYAPERLVFEGAPVLDPPLAQDRLHRQPSVTAGPPLDSRAVCSDLGLVEQARLRDLRAAERHRLAPAATAARNHCIAQFVARTGCTLTAARHLVEKRGSGILLPLAGLAFDDPDLQGMTVADVLADPARFVGATLADPAEGVDYGHCKAMVMQRDNGTLWIHSFAHGRTVYELKSDAAAVETALHLAPASEVASVFVRQVLAADLEHDERERLLAVASERGHVGKRALGAMLRTAEQTRDRDRAREDRERRAAERSDMRPQIPAPLPDAPWLPQMTAVNDVMAASCAPEPPMRDVEGCLAAIRVRRVPSMHLLTADGANDGDTEATRLPAPDEPLLTCLDEPQVAEAIERHIDYIDPKGRSVHLGTPFVRHYCRRDDHALPIVTAIVALPIVLANGVILSGSGLDRERGIVFRVPDAMLRHLPQPQDCTPTAVAQAMWFLTDEWLADAATDYAGKCVLIALPLTILERAILAERPAFLVSSGLRGSGKTTLIHMISMAVFGRRASAAAWSSSEEERRKALFAFLGEGLGLLVWDNIPRGAAIACPSIEKALTAATYTDRVLGATETRTVPATTIQVFTGNNIGPRGDMVSRALSARLLVNRTDPENRRFRHPDPIGWTEANRGRILAALYTILLGNPRLRESNPAAPETRFKAWWHLVGSAVEYAAKQHAEHVAALTLDADTSCKACVISCRKLFQDGEGDDEQTSALATVLDTLRSRWPDGCQARVIASYASLAESDAIDFRAALEQASGKAIKIITATVISWRLKALMDAPVQMADATFVLRYTADHHGGHFVVARVGDAG
jgi:hypothetical protein